MSNAAFDAFVAKLRAIAGLPELAAKEAAPLVDAAIKANVAAGLDPNGRPWKAKKDGSRPLVHAADHIKTEARGARIETTLTGVDVFHHHGVKDGAPERQILPKPGEMPRHVAAALEQGAARAFNKIMGGA